MNDPRPLRIAIRFWRNGYPAPLDIIQALVDLGLDVERLEARYRA